MPRRPRIILPNVPQHIIQRGNNRTVCFYADEDYTKYLEWLKEYADQTNCQIHAYVLMTNHVHLLASADKPEMIGTMMKALGQRYVQYINRTYKRSGTLWEGRYKSCPTQAETYLLSCQRYIELNPVRANMVQHPADYQWSSYRTNAQGELNNLISPHELYKRLGLDDTNRQSAYRELFRYQLEPKLVDEIRQATNGNYVLGNTDFVQQIERALDRRVSPGKAGRPKVESVIG
ncbi:transposase [Methylotenera sp. L2L1]|uniref:transposase n=1 Tax=Methylotenera sp. L2L1 TaxID=1502770 RepID=UPI00056D2098|nr:transposase [Methylotenera sp. L2L1]